MQKNRKGLGIKLKGNTKLVGGNTSDININPKAFEVVDVVNHDPKGSKVIDWGNPIIQVGTSNNSLNSIGTKWHKPYKKASSI